MGEAFIYNIFGQGNDGALDRVLNLPTNEAWLNPWIDHLRSLGVRFVANHGLSGYEMRTGRVDAVRLVDARGNVTRHESEWFDSSLPVTKPRTIWPPHRHPQ